MDDHHDSMRQGLDEIHQGLRVLLDVTHSLPSLASACHRLGLDRMADEVMEAARDVEVARKAISGGIGLYQHAQMMDGQEQTHSLMLAVLDSVLTPRTVDG